ncbi:hypothetical protein GALMADRAFT_55702 [Galerina marginata CBS 339.88]|uniref:Uncharacterized protein n=1 Tax=Galerina marginata (strain CBS 339.88) TaxID=685588 RepID=A0A067TKX9_GALM3|nr:hypothetical protein GALMADRAFT_55702 [Galerina marginata CBS 339.88]
MSKTTERAPIGSLNITFLGTASAQPSSTRNHSSLGLRLGSDVWLFDCGEATQHQLQKSNIKMGKIEKIFITHTHGDHIFGLIPLMASLLNGSGGIAEGGEDPRLNIDTDTAVCALEIYGPLGTRAYVRNGLAYTHTHLGASFVVHELRFDSDPQSGDFTAIPPQNAECLFGRNIPQINGCWCDIYKDKMVSVSAAPIHHSVPSVGYVVTEAPVPGKIDASKYVPELRRTKTPMTVMRQLQQGETVVLGDGNLLHGPPRRNGRKIVVLGDTYDPTPIAPLAEDADLLVHEATNAHLPGVDPNTKDTDTYESIETRAKSRGHSTPQMAGSFAKRIRARKLILNHFSSRYPGDLSEGSSVIMDAIAQLAESEYGQDVICARDLMSVDIAFSEK